MKHERDAVPLILKHVSKEAKVRADEASHWNILNAYYADFKTVNHSKDGYAVNGIHTNWVESFNGRIRRGQKGVHHHIAGPHLQNYADEYTWREDHRRKPNGGQFQLLLKGATRHPVSRNWAGYWQRGPSFRKE